MTQFLLKEAKEELEKLEKVEEIKNLINLEQNATDKIKL
jgi:hypothetical protein